MHEKDKKGKTNIVYQYLLQIINSPTFTLHDKLPTELEIVSKLGISRPTVSKAMRILIDEGMIYVERGVGSFINKKNDRKEDALVFGFLFPLLGKGEIFHPIINEIINMSETLNFSLVLGGNFKKTHDKFQQMNQMLDFYIKNNVDGIIMAPIELTRQCFDINTRIVEKIEKSNIALVLVDGDYVEFPYSSKFDLVGINNFQTSYKLAYHYIEQGVSRIDYFAFAYSAQTIPLRIKGYQQALLDANIMPSPDWVHSGDPEDVKNIEKIIKDGATNFICSNDDVAVRLIRSANRAGYYMPEHIRIIGFDNLEYAKDLRTPLTTVSQPCKDLARITIRTLQERITAPHLPKKRILLEPTINIRESSVVPHLPA